MAEETQDHQPDEIVAGGPGEDPAQPEPTETEAVPAEQPATPAEPAAEKVKLAGQEVEVTPDIAALLKQREEEFSRKLSEQGTELGELRKIRDAVVQQQTQPEPEPDQPGWDEILFEDPEKAKAQLLDEVRKIVAEEKSETIRQQQQQKAQEDYWVEFYDKNPELKSDQVIVEAFFQKRLPEMMQAGVSIPDSHGLLADEVQKYLLGVMGRSTSQPQRSTQVEGSSPPATPQAEPEDDGPKSLTEAMKDRKRKMREAQAAFRRQ